MDAELAAEFHEAMIRAAHHLRVDLLLVAPEPIAGVASPANLGYEHWASPDCCSEGLGFLPQAAFKPTRAVARSVRRLAAADTVLTAPLGADADPGVVQHAAGLLAATDRGTSA